MKRVLGNWLHWYKNDKSVGILPKGKCWHFKLEECNFITCKYWTFWRFFYSKNNKKGSD
jgi:hypothetical protein